MKWLKTVVGLLALTVMTPQALGQVTLKYISAGQAANMVSGSEMPTLASDEKFNMSLHKRVVSGHVEKHMGWNEELVIQKGDVLLNYDDTATNPRELSPGEFGEWPRIRDAFEAWLSPKNFDANGRQLETLVGIRATQQPEAR